MAKIYQVLTLCRALFSVRHVYSHRRLVRCEHCCCPHFTSEGKTEARGRLDMSSVTPLVGLAPACTLNYQMCCSKRSCPKVPVRPVTGVPVGGALVGCPWAQSLPFRTRLGGTGPPASSPGWPPGPDLALCSQEEEERRHQELLQKRKEEEQERLRKAAEAKRLAEQREQERQLAEQREQERKREQERQLAEQERRREQERLQAER